MDQNRLNNFKDHAHLEKIDYLAKLESLNLLLNTSATFKLKLHACKKLSMAIWSYQIEGNVIFRFLVNRIIPDDVLSSIIIVITLLKTVITTWLQRQSAWCSLSHGVQFEFITFYLSSDQIQNQLVDIVSVCTRAG